MTLCATCKSVDFRTLLVTCLQQCRERQEEEANNAECYDNPHPPSRVNHHDDIFEIEKSGRDCNLCKAIFQAFEKRKVADPEEARGLPIVFRALGNKIEVCYDAEEGLIELCWLDVYMDKVDSEYCLCKFVKKANTGLQPMDFSSVAR
jgi:hypothetical protein